MKKEKGKRNSEKVRTSILFTFSLLLITCSAETAALPEDWEVDLAAQPPQVFTLQRPRGETYELKAVLKRHGKPFEPAITNACIYWQTNGMENLYWSAPASVSNNVLRATWLPSMDPGATTVRGYIGDPGHIYAAAFQFRFISSPGPLPNALPLPTPVIDFAKVRVLNPPWSGGGGGGVDTNAVEWIANRAVETNAVTVGLSSSVSVLQSSKADKSTTYTKSETDAKLAGKLSTSGGAFSVGDTAVYLPLKVFADGGEIPAIGFSSNYRMGGDGLYIATRGGEPIFWAVPSLNSPSYLAGYWEYNGYEIARIYKESLASGELLTIGDGYEITGSGISAYDVVISSDLAAVATSGSYTDLSDTPDPYVPDATDPTFSNEVATVARTVAPPPSPTLRLYDEVRQCYWLGKMVNGVMQWEVE